MTDNSMAKRKRTKCQTTLHRKLKIDQHDTHLPHYQSMFSRHLVLKRLFHSTQVPIPSPIVL